MGGEAASVHVGGSDPAGGPGQDPPVEELRRLNEELEDRVRARTAELEAARATAEAASRSKSQFLAHVSHEIRTPMNAILGFSQLLLRDPDVTKDQRRHLETILRSGEHLLGLINDILTVSKIEAGRITLTPTSFDPVAMLREVAEMFRQRAEEAGVKLRVTIEGSVAPRVIADEGKLRQVLINLLGNALKFTSRGLIEIRADMREGRLFAIEVRDTGIGIALDEIDKLFAPFEQAREGAERGGTGLGLAISRGYVRLMGGDLNVESREGEGSTFRFEVPVSAESVMEDAAPKVERRVRALAPGQPRRRILVADDHDDGRAALCQLLVSVGFETSSARNGAEAIEAFARDAPDLVLMDIDMPVMNGEEATRRIRATPAGEDVPILAVTAGAFEDDRDRALAAGCDGVVVKPFREREVLDTIQACLGVVYVYEDHFTERPITGRTLRVVRHIKNLPPLLVEQMRDATKSADMDRLDELIGVVEVMDPDLAAGMRDLASAYEYDALEVLFDSLLFKPSEAQP